MNVKDLLNLSWDDIRKMKRADLGKIVTQLSSAANKRIRRFKEKGEVSPSVMYAEKGGKFSGRGKNINQMRAEYVRIKTFMSQKESTLRQWESIKTETMKTLESRGINIQREDFNEIMKLYGEVKSNFPDITDPVIYGPALQEIAERMKNGEDIDIIKDAAKSLMIEGYENMERSNNAFESGGVSGIIRG